jgi:hypothetical protein
MAIFRVFDTLSGVFPDALVHHDDRSSDRIVHTHSSFTKGLSMSPHPMCNTRVGRRSTYSERLDQVAVTAKPDQTLVEKPPPMISPEKGQMGDFMKGDGTGPLAVRGNVARELVIRLNIMTGGSMVSDDEVLTLARGASLGILRLGISCGLGAQARVISSELQSAAKLGKSKSLVAYDLCRKALELYLRENGIGGFFYILNSMLRKVQSIRSPNRAEFAGAVTEACGDLSDFIRLVWDGLNFEFGETPRREVVIFRGVELPEAVLESYRKSVGELFTWSMFSSFTEEREKAEEYGRSWRGGVEVLFELRSAWCRRLRNGTYLLHPFAVLRVEAVVGSTVSSWRWSCSTPSS